MTKNWVKIYSSTNEHQVIILKEMLMHENIISYSINKKDSSYLFGDIELYVESDDVLRALQIKKTVFEL
ncbi:MAG: DUF2007 domain-containing protein [Bacteroidales bacterium]|nr:DUF2007 domain-containing protein [Bacteroidales bacterium]